MSRFTVSHWGKRLKPVTGYISGLQPLTGKTGSPMKELGYVVNILYQVCSFFGDRL